MKITKPKTEKPCCPKCRHRGYAQTKAPDGRPLFTCASCGHTWTNGHDGGAYAGRVG